MDFGGFCLDALLHLLAQPREAGSQELSHLLASFGLAGQSRKRQQAAEGELDADVGDVPQEAALKLMALSETRLAIKVLQSWGVRQLTAELSGAFAAAVRRDVEAKAFSSVVAVMCAFPSVLEAEEAARVLAQVDEGNKPNDAFAVTIAAVLSRAAQIALVRRRCEDGRLRSAAKAVHALGLHADFPDMDYQWRAKALESAIERGAEDAVKGLGFTDVRLHEPCVRGLLTMEEYFIAVELAEAWGVQVSEADQEAAAAQRVVREEQSLRLPQSVQVHWVACDAEVAAMRAPLRDGGCVGFDAEWPAAPEGVPVLLQLATSAAAFLVDLVALAESDALRSLLKEIFSDSAVVTVGFSGIEDMKSIARGYPRLRTDAIAMCKPLDIRDLAGRVRSRERGVAKRKVNEGLSLAKVAERFLGKPLDKTLQMSDWRRRPLSPSQVQYAALDAWVCVGLRWRLKEALA